MLPLLVMFNSLFPASGKSVPASGRTRAAGRKSDHHGARGSTIINGHWSERSRDRRARVECDRSGHRRHRRCTQGGVRRRCHESRRRHEGLDAGCHRSLRGYRRRSSTPGSANRRVTTRGRAIAGSPIPRGRTTRTFMRSGSPTLAQCEFARAIVDSSGVDAKQAAKASLGLDLLLDAVAPTNFLVSNPTAMKRAFDTGGVSLLRGMRNLVLDVQSRTRAVRVRSTPARSPSART